MKSIIATIFVVLGLAVWGFAPVVLAIVFKDLLWLLTYLASGVPGIILIGIGRVFLELA